jgi:hypothetical protein
MSGHETERITAFKILQRPGSRFIEEGERWSLRTESSGVPVAGVTVAGVPVAGVPVAGVTVAGVPVAGVPVAGVTVAGVPVAGVTVAGVPVAGVTVAGVTVAGVTQTNIIISLIRQLQHFLPGYLPNKPDPAGYNFIFMLNHFTQSFNFKNTITFIELIITETICYFGAKMKA